MHERIEWGLAGAGVEAMSVEHSCRLYHVVLDKFMLGQLTYGQVEWRSRGAVLTQQPGDLIFGDPGELYVSDRHAAPGTWHALFVDADVVRRAAAEIGARDSLPHFQRSQGPDHQLSVCLQRFHRAFRTGASELTRDTYLTNCLRLLLERHAEHRPATTISRPVHGEPQAVQRAREFIDAHVAEAVTLDALSDAAGLSKFQLVRAFRRALGVPPHRYQVLQRVSLARRLIAQGLTLSYIASLTGFSSQTHLHRHFLRVVGVTPGAFQRSGGHHAAGGARTWKTASQG